jgi:diadenosine tetraphosphatase ApaH/serine/threonine PP2A family protein phosphatase
MLALLYDVHGNLPALQAVLDDATGQGAGEFVLGGDYALFGPWPAETLAALRELRPASWIRGNVDRWTAEIDLPDDAGLRQAVADCRAAIGSEAARELGELPKRAIIDDTLYCHASPANDMESFLPDPGDEDDRLLDGADQRRIVFGHTHLQFERTGSDGRQLVNPGSVGLPLDGDHRAAYALVGDDGEIELRRAPYDHEASARAVRERFGEAEWAVRSERRLLEARP